MPVKPLLYVFLGGGLGACTRYAITLWLTRDNPYFSWSTLLANLCGCLLLGLIIGLREKAGLTTAQYAFFAVGFCGALTTFSTWIYDQQQLLEFRGMTIAALYVFVSWMGGWLLFALGNHLARVAW